MEKIHISQADILQKSLQSHLYFLNEIVSLYGGLRTGPDIEYSLENHYYDFVFLCLTKSARSIDAIDILITQSFSEDAMSLARSVYECYLHLAYIQRNKHRVDEFVFLKIHSYVNRDSHPKSKSGKPIYGKVIHPSTGETKELGGNLIELSKDTGKELDAEIHTGFYSLLSEFSHVHMIAGSSYWDSKESAYAVTPCTRNLYQSILWSLYGSWLIINNLCSLELINEEHQKQSLLISTDTARLLYKNIDKMEHGDSISTLAKNIMSRLEDALTTSK